MAPTPCSEYTSRHSEAKTLNATTEDKNAVTSAHGDRSSNGNDLMVWFGWMMFFGAVGIFVTAGVQHFVTEWCEGDLARQSREWMVEQTDQVRRGEINCLVNPDPAFVEELLADTGCAAKVRDIYLGGGLSDPRLARLRKLPNVKCIVFLFAENQNALLNRLHGMSSIEELSFDRTRLSREDMEQIGAFPNLKSLSFDACDLRPADLHGLGGHRSIERLAIDRATSDKKLIPLLKSLPCLRELSIGASNKERDAFQTLLNDTLPRCKCRVSEDDR